MNTTANLFQTQSSFGGEALPYRRVANDTRGYIAEMLAKAVHRHALDDQLDEGDREALLSLLKSFGDLGYNGNCPDDTYCGSMRSGCRFPLNVYEAGEYCDAERPLPFQALLDSEFWKHRFYQPDDYLWQPTLFEPTGGMDKIVDGFMNQIGEHVQLSAVVQNINILADGVQVEYERDGESLSARADYCVSNIPMPVLQKIPTNFTRDFQAAVDFVNFANTCKVGWQSNDRFWENDHYQIYGGISWINNIITQIWYPSFGFFTQPKATLTGAYNFDEDAVRLGRMSLADRLVVARDGAVRLHPEFRDDATIPEALGLSIAWQNVPFQEGGWADWKDTARDRQAYARLLEPDEGKFYVVGDQVSTLPGWQEGAMMSAEHVVNQIAGLTPKRKPTVLRAPDSRRLTQGG